MTDCYVVHTFLRGARHDYGIFSGMVTQNQKRNGETPPDILWHYTTQEGFLGIIKGKNLRATNIFYLNDATEYKYAKGLLKDVLGSYFPYTNLNNDLQNIINKVSLRIAEDTMFDNSNLFDKHAKYKMLLTIQDAVEKLEFNETYILSFTKKGDDLNQWRAYCPHNNGFCIGFSKSELYKRTENLIARNAMFLEDCLYLKEKQENLIRQAIDEALTEFEKDFGNSADKKKTFNDCLLDFMLRLLRIIPRLKHASFMEEKESRLIYVKLIKTAEEPVNFRAGKSMLVPYIEFPLSDKDDITILKKIIVGPTPHMHLSVSAAKSLLETYKVRDCEVVRSEVPYRDWQG